MDPEQMNHEMDNDGIIEKLTAESGDLENGPAATENWTKFLIVEIGKDRYGFHARQIKEIVTDQPIYYVPFVPPYIKGFINRHGEPHTAFDLSLLFGKQGLDGEMFLVSRHGGDQLAFQISDVTEILKVPEGDLRSLSSVDDGESYFSGVLSLEGADIFVLNIDSLVARLERDLGDG